MKIFSFILNPYHYVSKNPNSHYRFILILNAWFFQGFGNTDTSEKIYKILFEILVLVPMLLIISTIVNSLAIALFIAAIISHSINWIVNSGIWCMFRGKYGLKIEGVGLNSFEEYKLRLVTQARKNGGISKILVYGSYARGENKYNSDLDLRVIRKSGLFNAVKAMSYGIEQRTYALIKLIPLDMVILDSDILLNKMDSSEKPIMIYNSGFGVKPN